MKTWRNRWLTLLYIFALNLAPFSISYAINLEQDDVQEEESVQYMHFNLGASLGLPYLLGLDLELVYFRQDRVHPYIKLQTGTANVVASSALMLGLANHIDNYIHGVAIGRSKVIDNVDNVDQTYRGYRVEYQIRRPPQDFSRTGSTVFVGFDYLPDSTLQNNTLFFIGTSFYLDFKQEH